MMIETEQYLEKPLPSSPDSERVVLGAILLDNTLITQAVELIKEDDFYSPLHRRVYKAMLSLFERGEHIDPILIGEQLRMEGQLENVGGISTITNLTYGYPNLADIETHSKVIKDKAIARSLVKCCSEITSLVLAEDESIETVANYAEQRIFETCEMPTTSHPVSAGALAKEAIEKAQRIARGEIKTDGVPSGFADIDKIINGFKPSNLIIVAARPSIGKSALCHQIAFNSAKADFVTAVFSPEMSKEMVIKRMICSEAKIDSQRFENGMLTREEWGRVAEVTMNIDELKLDIDDSPQLTSMELLAKARRIFAVRKRLDLIVVDYLQLMQPSRKTDGETAAITQISKDLKAVAKLLKVPLIAISSLSRKSEERADKKPQMSDLRQSGQIEYDADVVAFLHRDDYYHETEENSGIAEFIVAKQRNGPTDKVKLAFMKEFTRFENYYAPSYGDFYQSEALRDWANRD